MKVIIPAAGFGSRLRPHTFTSPKAMLPVAGKPMIGHIIEQVESWGATKVTVIVGHLRAMLEEYLKRAFTLPFEFREQEQMLGLGHAVLTGLDDDDEEVLIILGDTILETDLRPVIKSGVTSIGVKSVEDARKFGVVEKNGETVTKLTEKSPNPPSNLAIVGVYYIRNGGQLARAIREIIEQGITVKGEYQLTDALQMLINWGETIQTFPVEGWYDCGKPETLLETNRFLLGKSGGETFGGSSANSILIQPVIIGEGATIENSIIGPDVSIGSRAEIRDSIVSNAICGDDVVITKSLITSSLLGNRSRVRGHFNQINLGASGELDF